MKIAVTGGTGFIGHYIIRRLASEGHSIRAWRRQSSNTGTLDSLDIDWLVGDLTDQESIGSLVSGCDAVVHAALWKPGARFRGGEGEVSRFAGVNVIGTLQLVSAAMAADVDRFVFLSTCAVYESILEDRPLDEAHPCWPGSHYGAHKAAIENFVHSFGKGQGYNICALRPVGVYGVHHIPQQSKWFELIGKIKRGESVSVSQGGKEVHAADVAQSVSLLLESDDVAGEAFNCYDRYVSQYEVASMARKICGSSCKIDGEPKTPKHQIETGKLESRGVCFGGLELLDKTTRQLVDLQG